MKIFPKIKATSYLRRLDPELKEIQKEFNLKPEDLDEIIDEFFKILKNVVEDNRMPKIQITNFGTFRPSIKKINYDIKRSIIGYREGRVEYEYLKARIKRLWAVKQRLIQEKNGISTWKEWKKIKLEKEKPNKSASE